MQGSRPSCCSTRSRRQERSRAERVESVLPALRDAAAEADRLAEFPMQHVKTLSEAGLLGLVVPEEYGGLGGGLRDLAAATFAMGTACPSTALAYFFQCSSTVPGAAAAGGDRRRACSPRTRCPSSGPSPNDCSPPGPGRAVDGQLRVGVGQVGRRGDHHLHPGPSRASATVWRLAAQRREVVRVRHRCGRRLPRLGHVPRWRHRGVPGHVHRRPRDSEG